MPCVAYCGDLASYQAQWRPRTDRSALLTPTTLSSSSRVVHPEPRTYRNRASSITSPEQRSRRVHDAAAEMNHVKNVGATTSVAGSIRSPAVDLDTSSDQTDRCFLEEVRFGPETHQNESGGRNSVQAKTRAELFAEISRVIDDATECRYLFSFLGSRVHGCHGAHSDVNVCLLLHTRTDRYDGRDALEYQLRRPLEKVEGVTNVADKVSSRDDVTFQLRRHGVTVAVSYVLWKPDIREGLVAKRHALRLWDECQPDKTSRGDHWFFWQVPLDAENKHAGGLQQLHNDDNGLGKLDPFQVGVRGNEHVITAIAACLAVLNGRDYQPPRRPEDLPCSPTDAFAHLARVHAGRVECSAYARRLVDAEALQAFAATQVEVEAGPEDHALRPMFSKISYLMSIGMADCATSARFCALVETTQQQLVPASEFFPSQGNIDLRAACAFLLQWATACGLKTTHGGPPLTKDEAAEKKQDDERSGWARTAGEARFTSIEIVALFLSFVRDRGAKLALARNMGSSTSTSGSSAPLSIIFSQEVEFSSSRALFLEFFTWLRDTSFEKCVLRPFARQARDVLTSRDVSSQEPRAGSSSKVEHWARVLELVPESDEAEIVVSPRHSEFVDDRENTSDDESADGDEIVDELTVRGALWSGATWVVGESPKRGSRRATAGKNSFCVTESEGENGPRAPVGAEIPGLPLPDELASESFSTPIDDATKTRMLFDLPLLSPSASDDEEQQLAELLRSSIIDDLDDHDPGQAIALRTILQDSVEAGDVPSADVLSALVSEMNKCVQQCEDLEKRRVDDDQLAKKEAEIMQEMERQYREMADLDAELQRKKQGHAAGARRDSAAMGTPPQSELDRALVDLEKMDPAYGSAIEKESCLFRCREWRALPTSVPADLADPEGDAGAGLADINPEAEEEDGEAAPAAPDSRFQGHGAAFCWSAGRRQISWENTPLALVWSEDPPMVFSAEAGEDGEAGFSWSLREVRTARLQGAAGRQVVERLQRFAARSVDILEKTRSLRALLEKKEDVAGRLRKKTDVADRPRA